MKLASLILGTIGCCFAFFGLFLWPFACPSIVIGIVAIVLSLKARGNEFYHFDGISLSGFVTGIVGTALGAIVFTVAMIVLGSLR